MKKFRIEMPYEGKRVAEITANSKEEALKMFRESDAQCRSYSPEKYLNEIALEEGKGDIVEVCDIKEDFKTKYADFNAEKGTYPRFATVTVRFKNDGFESKEIICIDKDMKIREGSALDNAIFFHYKGENLIESMFGDGEDFDIIEVHEVMNII